MTRSGSLAYYLTAWICGCFFMSLAVWTRDLFGANADNAFSTHSVFGLIFFYFYGLVFGAIAAPDGEPLGSRRGDFSSRSYRDTWTVGTARRHRRTKRHARGQDHHLRPEDCGGSRMVARNSSRGRNCVLAVPSTAGIRRSTGATAFLDSVVTN
jgi:hypothetical protein